MEIHTEQKKIVSKKMANYAIWGTIGIFVIIFIFTSFGGNSNIKPTGNSENNLPSQPAQVVSKNIPTKVGIGEEGYISVPSPKAVIALTENGYKEITKIYLANDMIGVGDFLLSGKGFAVPNGTKVLVVDTSVGARKVRVLEGDSIGESGWIAYEWVSKTK